jgi:hypothetical protein
MSPARTFTLLLMTILSACAVSEEPSDDGSAALAEAFQHHRSDLRVQGEGVVTRTLSDDNHGDRHQRFLLRLSSGQTVLIAHNIDVAPRLEGPHPGDRVRFAGEYEWNEQGGVIHWTHRDSGGSHQDGWLEYRGRRVD